MQFPIDPQPGESVRACTAIVQNAISTTRGNVIVFGLYAAVGAASYVLTPATRLLTFVIGTSAVLGTMSALQAESRARLRRLQDNDPHRGETYFVEVTSTGLRTWCAHVDARYTWADFLKVAENSEFYLFVRPNGSGSALPKRLLTDVMEAELRESIRAWSPDNGSHLARENGR